MKGIYLSTVFFVICPYRRKSPAMYNKHSVGNFGPFVSIADRAEALPEHAKRVSWPEPCLIGGGTKGPKNCRECVYTWRGSFGPFGTKSQLEKSRFMYENRENQEEILRTNISFVYSSRIAITRLRILYTYSCRAGFFSKQVMTSPYRKPF